MPQPEDRPYHAPRLSRRWYRNWAIVCAVVLAATFFTRDSGSTETLFGVTAVFGISLGVFLGGWLHEHY